MKKVGIMTYHRANNYGAVLQAYALQKYLEKQNVESEIVDYQSTYLEKAYRGISLSGGLKTKLSALSNFPIQLVKEKKFDAFRHEYLITSKKYLDDAIMEASDDFGSFVFGSDQIWNYDLSGKDKYYLGAFIKNPQKLNSYAASFGTFRSNEEEYVRLLRRFNNVSIREESGLEFFEKVTGRKDAEIVVDPVFLLERDEWKKLACKPKKKGYIFLYTLQGKTTQMMKAAEELSRNTGLPIVEMQAWFRPKPKNVRPRFWDDPIDFLSWINDADFVVTDSFHCTAFSIIFRKKFWVKIAECKNQRQSRVGNLLYSLKLESQIMPDDTSKWEYEYLPDFELAEIELHKVIQRSKEFLIGVIDKEITK